MSTHGVFVVRLGEIVKHPNADALGVTEIGGFDVIVRTEEWRAGDVGVYIEPDYVVPDAVLPDFLKGKNRIRVKKLRGVYSQGLLLPLRAVGLGDDTPVGTDVMSALGITRYEGPAESSDEEAAPPPACAAGLVPYDLESWRGRRGAIAPDEWVMVTEKLHGESARFVFDGDAMHAGSRVGWKRLDGKSSWAIALRCNPWIDAWCRHRPNTILYGEVFGNVPTMAYGVPRGQRGFRAFDAWRDGAWMTGQCLAQELLPEQHVPVLFVGPYRDADMLALAEGHSTLAAHVREGAVVKLDGRDRRVALKCVGNGYHARGD